jgi:hypothetical protein
MSARSHDYFMSSRELGREYKNVQEKNINIKNGKIGNNLKKAANGEIWLWMMQTTRVAVEMYKKI